MLNRGLRRLHVSQKQKEDKYLGLRGGRSTWMRYERMIESWQMGTSHRAKRLAEER